MTAQSDLENETIDEDLLDVTAVSDGTQEFDLEAESADEEKPESGGLDLDLGSETEDDNVIEFEGAASPADVAGDKGGDEPSEDGGLEFDLSADSEEPDVESGEELSLDQGGDDEGLEFELDDSTLDLQVEEPSAEAPSDDGGAGEGGGFELDLSVQEDAPVESGGADDIDLDMEGTVELPKLELEDADEEDDDDEDHTVFVPRSKATTEQSAEDEIATKLDLAKTWPFVQVFATLPKDVQVAGMRQTGFLPIIRKMHGLGG